MMKKHLKKFVSVALAAVMAMGIPVTSFASDQPNNQLQAGYSDIAERAEAYDIPFSMTFAEYESAFADSGFSTPEEYADAYLGVLDPPVSTSSSSSSKWYYNIGTSLPSNANPKYDSYNLYDTVKKGDIIFEAKGGFGITGHIAIVEGKYYNAAKDVNYIRIIEAIDVGVVRSCLDDTRVDDKDVTLLRVSSATSSNIK